MQLNTRTTSNVRTHEGGSGFGRMTDLQALRRSVASCLLWEKEFYEDGEDIANRILELALKVPADDLAALAIEVREDFKLRHAPLMLLYALTTTGAGRADGLVSRTIERVIQRTDELTEFVALYKHMGGKSLSKQVKLGLANAFGKFDEYALAKYNRDTAWKLRDVLFMTHAKPKDDEQADLWRRLVDGELKTPDTWETNLSAGADKRETFERLLREGNLGYLALLRNLRNMAESGVDTELVRDAILARKGAHRVLPFRYVAAARAAPQFEPALDQALSEAVSGMDALPGKTVVLIDVSGSMYYSNLSAKSDLRRVDAAATLGSIINGDVRVFAFANEMCELPPRLGMAGVDAIVNCPVANGGTHLGGAIAQINQNIPHDRLIVITDEQSHDRVPGPREKGYMINVASNRNGVGYGPWVHIDGFSENVLRFVHEHERQRT